jgi:ectoine hydroxylase-related dioxygenase (phytanoyl-CoA dioxygenase family)
MNLLWIRVTHGMMAHRHKVWAGQTQVKVVSKPEVSATVVFSIRPGARSQVLHCDDGNSHNVLLEITPKQYECGREEMIGMFVVGTRTTRQNGTTQWVPKSHLQYSLTRLQMKLHILSRLHMRS